MTVIVRLGATGLFRDGGVNAVGFGRDYRHIAEIQGQLAGFVTFVSAIHDEGAGLSDRAKVQQELSAPLARRGPGLATGQRLWRSDHSRQPDEFWWSIPHGIGQWFGGRFF